MPESRSHLPAALVALCGGLNAALLIMLAGQRGGNNDFRGPYSFVRFARGHAARLYHARELAAFQRHLYPGFRSFYPYQYPPSFLPPLWWLRDFGFVAAELLWSVAGIAALASGAWLLYRRGERGFAILALLACPASLLNLAAGETGNFTTGLLLAGFGLLPVRPVAAGIAFGLLTLKPQLGVLVPLALLARGEGRAMLAAATAAAALALLSCLFLPAALWGEWLRVLPPTQTEYLAASMPAAHGNVTIAGNLAALRLPGLAWPAQALGAALTASAAMLALRIAPYRLGVAALLSGTFLCAPHAWAYDTMPLVAAMLLLPGAPALAPVCAAIYLAPYLLLLRPGWFLYTIPEALLFFCIICLAFGRRPRPIIADEPVPAGKPPPP